MQSKEEKTNYWAFEYRICDKRDLGHKCKECK
jgi:hypothetical protein